MKVRFPLYAKILLWFFLNLLLVGLILYGFARVQFHLGLDSLLMGRTGDRIQAVADVVTLELRRSQPADWNDIMRQFSDAYHVEFTLFRADGSQAAGQSVILPEDVAARVKLPRHPEPRTDAPPPHNGTDFAPHDGIPPPDPIPPDPGDGHAHDMRGRGPPGGPPRFMLHTDNPARYWVGIRLPGLGHIGGGPITLLAQSKSIRGGGLFFDYTPWLAAGFGCLLVSTLFWFPLLRGITRSISQITHATQRIAEGRFETRVAASRSDELGRLGGAINQMAARLSGLVSGQKRFLGDIAHELCSPIARVQVALGILEQRADEKQSAYLEDLREEVQQMSSLVNELLSFSKASLEPAALRLEPVGVREVVDKALRRESLEAARVEIQVKSDLVAWAEPELLVRSLGNLLRNAVRYAAQGGPITVNAHREGDQVVITVADCGPGVPESALAQLFDPFYRLEPSRNREAGGVGLGLAIVKTCVESCQGGVTCKNRQPSGLEVTITLRAAPAGK